MAKQSGYDGPSEALDWYDRVVASDPTFERKGAKLPYTSRNGHMFSFLDARGAMALKLPPSAIDEFLERYQTTLVEEYGHVMKGYVLVPAALLRSTGELRVWLTQSYEYVGTLKPKATARG